MNLAVLNSEDFVFFSTRDFAFASGTSLSSASRKLTSLARQGFVRKLTRGLWANVKHPHYHPLGATPYLLGNEQGYVSFLTALHLHGLVSQIPARIQIASTGHSRELQSELAHFEFFKMSPSMMSEGIKWSDTKQNYRIAKVEKALLDTLYLSTRRGNRFASLPELHFEDCQFDQKYFWELMKSIKDKRIYNAVLKRAQELFKPRLF